jgi:hypothetical protein
MDDFVSSGSIFASLVFSFLVAGSAASDMMKCCVAFCASRGI